MHNNILMFINYNGKLTTIVITYYILSLWSQLTIRVQYTYYRYAEIKEYDTFTIYIFVLITLSIK